jgi:hypothetical protein
MRIASASLFAIGLAALGTVDIALAQQDGAMASLHAQRREGGKICMADHFHNGSSSGQPSRKAAEIAAIRDWAGFTAWEYGTHWGNYGIAGSKRINCTQSGSSWGCDLEARPCKPAR